MSKKDELLAKAKTSKSDEASMSPFEKALLRKWDALLELAADIKIILNKGRDV